VLALTMCRKNLGKCYYCTWSLNRYWRNGSNAQCVVLN